jgi:hypothetical protein
MTTLIVAFSKAPKNIRFFEKKKFTRKYTSLHVKFTVLLARPFVLGENETVGSLKSEQ